MKFAFAIANLKIETLRMRKRFARVLSAPAIFIYLFIYLFVDENEVLVTWFLVWVFRREKTRFQYTVSRLCFVGGHFFFQLLFFADFEDFSRCAFSSQGK